MSKQQSSTMSYTCMHLKKFPLFLVFAWQKHSFFTSGAIINRCIKGSININQNTNITVQEVEHQKTVNARRIALQSSYRQTGKAQFRSMLTSQ